MFRNRSIKRAKRPTLVDAAKFLPVLGLILIQNVAPIGGYASRAPAATAEARAAAAAAAYVDTHRLAKRMDLESCLGQFEVHKNTIIRTGESQAIGGKYLQGLELDTAEECQRLCCETDSCDVYIFEDKNDGYCYLFECGPPENFHCKFTRHANYTSAVLVSVRHTIETTTTRPTVPHAATNNISQQEWELASLKVKPETREKEPEGVASAAAAASGGMGAAAAVGVAGGVPQAAQPEVGFPQKVSPVNGHCGRFQFTCHSGECIAVYNACDGIPQCEDGSDEGPECSGATSASAISTAKTGADANILEAATMRKQQAAAMPHYPPNVVAQNAQQHLQAVQQQQQQLQQPQSQQQQQQQQQTHAALTPPLINNREDAGAWANRKIVANALQVGQAENAGDLNSRIFSHKGGLQLPTAGNANGNANAGALASYANNNNNNANANLLYNTAALQHNGVYMPQTMDVTGGVYVPQQQQQQMPQLMQPQGHLMLPPNVNWQMQQQQQQPQILSVGGMPPQQGPTYIINAPHQQPLAPPVQAKAMQQTSGAVNVPVPAQPAAPAPVAPQQAAAPAAAEKTALQSAKAASGAGGVAGQTAEAKKTANAAAAAAAATADGYDDYEEEEEKSTEPPKRKQRKHKKAKSKSAIAAPPTEATATAAVAVAAAAQTPLDPIELALEQQKLHAPPPAPVHEQYKQIQDTLAMEFHDHDGQSERPGGAMLSLTLGLLVTAALAILMGCRMRTVGRRARRLGGKAPYSHEADFLVNGMYL